MSRRRKRDVHQPGLFDDFELRPELGEPTPVGAGEDDLGERVAAPAAEHRESEPEAVVGQAESLGTDAEHAAAPRQRIPVSAGIRARCFGGLVDLFVHVALMAIIVVLVKLMGVEPRQNEVVPFALLTLVFSLFYTVIPLAFWGQTPGMAAAGITARAEDGGPMSFSQASRRWIGGLLTAGLVGLPLLLALSGRSLSDRLSGSKTFESESSVFF